MPEVNDDQSPDPGQGYHDEFGWVSGSSGTEQAGPVAALSRAYPAWAINFYAALQVYTAERRDGTAVHVLVAYQPSDLAVKIEAAESGNPDA